MHETTNTIYRRHLGDTRGITNPGSLQIRATGWLISSFSGWTSWKDTNLLKNSHINLTYVTFYLFCTLAIILARREKRIGIYGLAWLSHVSNPLKSYNASLSWFYSFYVWYAVFDNWGCRGHYGQLSLYQFHSCSLCSSYLFQWQRPQLQL